VDHHKRQWRRWDLQDDDLKKRILRRLKPRISPSSPIPEKAQVPEATKNEDEFMDQENCVEIYISCSETTFSLSSSSLFWTVPKLIGHFKTPIAVLKPLFLCLKFFLQLWDPGGILLFYIPL